MFVTFKKDFSMIGGMIYCLLEGLFIGGISAFAEAYYPIITIQAVFDIWNPIRTAQQCIRGK